MSNNIAWNFAMTYSLQLNQSNLSYQESQSSPSYEANYVTLLGPFLRQALWYTECDNTGPRPANSSFLELNITLSPISPSSFHPDSVDGLLCWIFAGSSCLWLFWTMQWCFEDECYTAHILAVQWVIKITPLRTQGSKAFVSALCLCNQPCQFLNFLIEIFPKK